MLGGIFALYSVFIFEVLKCGVVIESASVLKIAQILVHSHALVGYFNNTARNVRAVVRNALKIGDKIGKNVVIIGGGEVGVETGMFLAQKGRNVTVIEMRDELAADSTATHYRSMFEEAWKAIDNFHYVLNASAKQISKDHVTYTDKDGNDHDLPADSVILSVGMRSKSEEALSFYGKGREFWMVGDCKKPGTIQTTNRSAYGAAVNI